MTTLLLIAGVDVRTVEAIGPPGPQLNLTPEFTQSRAAGGIISVVTDNWHPWAGCY